MLERGGFVIRENLLLRRALSEKMRRYVIRLRVNLAKVERKAR